MNRKELSAYLAGCKASEMMAYADLGDQGCVVIAPDGRKFRYSNDQLGEAAEASRALARAPKPKPKQRKAATKPKKGPAKKSETKTKAKPETKPRNDEKVRR